MDCSLPGSPVRGNLQARILKTLPFPPPGYLPDSRIEPTSLVSCSLPLAPPGKPLNTVSQLYFNKLFLKRTIGWSYSTDKGVGLRFWVLLSPLWLNLLWNQSCWEHCGKAAGQGVSLHFFAPLPSKEDETHSPGNTMIHIWTGLGTEWMCQKL